MKISVRTMPVVASALVLLAAAAQGVQDWTFDGHLGLGQRRGDLTYQIGKTYSDSSGQQSIPYPISKLEFQDDLTMATFGGSATFRGKWEARLSLSMNVTDDAGTLKDSDFDYAGGSRDLTIYSESDLTADARDLDLGVRRWFPGMYKTMPSATWGVGLGCLVQSTEWTSGNGLQVSKDPDIAPLLQLEPGSIVYKADTFIPYGEVCLRWTGGALSMDGRAGYSPYLTVSDRDDHAARQILSTTDADGTGWLAGLKMRYAFSGPWFAQAEASVLDYSADGTSKSKAYGKQPEPDVPAGGWSTYEKIETQQFDVTLAIGRTF